MSFLYFIRSFLPRLKSRITSALSVFNHYSTITSKIHQLKDSPSPVVSSLIDQGYYVFPDRLPDTIISALLKDYYSLSNHSSSHKSGQLTGRISSSQILSLSLSKLSESVSKSLIPFFDSHPRVELSYFQISYPEEVLSNVPGGDFHVDDTKYNFKYIIYLTNVSSENGPLCLVPKSGLYRLPFSRLRSFLWELSKIRFFLYSFCLNTRNYDALSTNIVGPRGTHFIIDTTSLHRATRVNSACRLVAVISYNTCNLVE